MPKKKKTIKVKVEISAYGRPFQIVLKHKLQQKGHTANYTRERKKVVILTFAYLHVKWSH